MFNFNIDDTNLDKCLEELKEKSQKSGDAYDLSLEEFLTVEFLTKQTNFTSLEEMFAAGNLVGKDCWKSYSKEDWDRFISSQTKFNSWKQLIHAAVQEWFVNKLGSDKIFMQ